MQNLDEITPPRLVDMPISKGYALKSTKGTLDSWWGTWPPSSQQQGWSSWECCIWWYGVDWDRLGIWHLLRFQITQESSPKKERLCNWVNRNYYDVKSWQQILKTTAKATGNVGVFMGAGYVRTIIREMPSAWWSRWWWAISWASTKAAYKWIDDLQLW